MNIFSEYEKKHQIRNKQRNCRKWWLHPTYICYVTNTYNHNCMSFLYIYIEIKLLNDESDFPWRRVDWKWSLQGSWDIYLWKNLVRDAHFMTFHTDFCQFFTENQRIDSILMKNLQKLIINVNLQRILRDFTNLDRQKTYQIPLSSHNRTLWTSFSLSCIVTFLTFTQKSENSLKTTLHSSLLITYSRELNNYRRHRHVQTQESTVANHLW